MQPSNGPDPSYQFILNDTPQPKKSLLPGGGNKLFIGLGVLIAILLLVLLYGLFTGNKGGSNTAALIDVVGKSKEISRISVAQQPNLKDPTTAALASTVSAAMASDSTQMNNYLAQHKVKVGAKKLAVYAANDKDIDSQLSQAAANNNLDTAYINYLKKALSDYSQTLKDAYAGSTKAAAKSILQKSFDSTQTLLSSSLLKS